MATQTWLKRHRRQVAVHSCVIAGFLLFTLFAVEPLFERLERVPGEARLHRVDLPSETEGVRSHIDTVETDGRTMLDVAGWAFLAGVDSEGSRTYIVLRSAARTYVFDTTVQARPDVTRYFAELGLELDYSGFRTLIPARKIADGEYRMGIYIKKGDIEALQYTDHVVVKSGSVMEVTAENPQAE